MEWVSRYLDQVGQYLPEDKRVEVTTELREAIEGELEGLAETRPGPVTEADEKAVLERFGHPLKVARDYHPLRYLIGPALYPSWWQTVKQVAVLVLAIQVVAGLVVGLSTGWRIGAFDLLGLFINGQFWAFAVVTGVYIAIEFSGERPNHLDRWRADRLPAASVAPIRRGDVLTNLFSEGVFLLWWNDVLVLSRWLPDSIPAFPLQAGPAWDGWFWPLNIVFGLAFALHLWVLMRGVWQRPTLWAEIATGLGVIVAAIAICIAGDLVVVRELPADSALQVLGRAELFIERTLKIALLVVAGFTAWDVWKAWRLLLPPTPGLRT